MTELCRFTKRTPEPPSHGAYRGVAPERAINVEVHPGNGGLNPTTNTLATTDDEALGARRTAPRGGLA